MSNGVWWVCRICDRSPHLHLWNEFQVLQRVSVGSQRWSCTYNKLSCFVLNITYCNVVAVSCVGAPLGASIWSSQAGSDAHCVGCMFFLYVFMLPSVPSRVQPACGSDVFILNLPVVCISWQYFPFLMWPFLCLALRDRVFNGVFFCKQAFISAPWWVCCQPTNCNK